MIKAKSVDRKDFIYSSSALKLSELHDQNDAQASPELTGNQETPENDRKIIEDYNNNKKKQYLQGGLIC